MTHRHRAISYQGSLVISDCRRRVFAGVLTLLLATSLAVVSSARADERWNQGMLNAVLWMQSSAEYDAVALQTFRNATFWLEWLLADDVSANARKSAVVLDIDETVLLNTPYEAWLITEGRRFDLDSWTAWCKQAASEPVPGVQDYVRAAMAHNLHLVFITNRSDNVAASTRQNLARLGLLPEDARVSFYFRDDEKRLGGDASQTGKQYRLRAANERFNVLQVLGDNLDDFTGGGEFTAAQRRTQAADSRGKWGVRWFMLPNPVYGEWYNSLQTGQKPGTASKAFTRDAQLLEPMNY